MSVQSMTTTLTADVDATLQQIAELTTAGCDIVRVAVPSQDDADALPAIAKKSQIPVIARTLRSIPPPIRRTISTWCGPWLRTTPRLIASS